MPKRPELNEFELIAKHLAPLARSEPGALGLLDDAAILDIPADSRLVVAADMAVEGEHFNADDPPSLIARKVLRYNLSDLAAMGAAPLSYLLTLAKPESRSTDWVAGLAEGLAVDQATYGITLVGGDTTGTAGPACLSVTVLGLVEPGSEIRRSGAKPGDLIFVSGTIGDAGLGLLAIQGELDGADEADREWLAGRYRLPEPRLSLGLSLRRIATAAIDVSDGLIADLGHICTASGVGAMVEADRVPLSPATKRAVGRNGSLINTVLSAGDDYELLFCARPDQAAEIKAIEKYQGIQCTKIGQIRKDDGIDVIGSDGSPLTITRGGFRHF